MMQKHPKSGLAGMAHENALRFSRKCGIRLPCRKCGGLTIYESDKLRRNGVLNRRKEACHCKNVTYGMIEDAIRNGANTLQQVMDATGAGKGCGKCKEFLAYLIRDIQEERKNG